MHIGDLTKSVTDGMRRVFGRDVHNEAPEAGDDDFIRTRAARLSSLTDAQIERIGADALATVDRDTTLREAQAMHERSNVQPGQSARSNRQ